jgi:hypothetical protein
MKSPATKLWQPEAVDESLREHREALRSFLQRGGHYIVIVGLYQADSETDLLSPYVMVERQAEEGQDWPYMQWIGGRARHLIDEPFNDKQNAFVIGGGGFNKADSLATDIMQAAYGPDKESWPPFRYQSVAFEGRFPRR